MQFEACMHVSVDNKPLGLLDFGQFNEFLTWFCFRALSLCLICVLCANEIRLCFFEGVVGFSREGATKQNKTKGTEGLNRGNGNRPCRLR